MRLRFLNCPSITLMYINVHGREGEMSDQIGRSETLVDVLRAIEADANLSKNRKRAVATHLRTFARVQGNSVR